jgi:hypothetical protein
MAAQPEQMIGYISLLSDALCDTFCRDLDHIAQREKVCSFARVHITEDGFYPMEFSVGLIALFCESNILEDWDHIDIHTFAAFTKDVIDYLHSLIVFDRKNMALYQTIHSLYEQRRQNMEGRDE